MATEEQRIEQEAPEGDPTPPAPAAPEQAAPAAEPDTSAAAEPAAAEPAPEPELDAAALRERADKADDYLALAQRTKADFENYRKRMTRDVKAAEARGMGRLARELLPALDNLERAVAALEAADEDHHMTNGIRLVTSELTAALGRTGIEGYAAKGERFDPVCHEAVAQHAVEGTEPGTIVEVLQAGYRLNDSILRPARVIVSG
ncbi:MAG TPA: nucleotide exchange factor GrpE [Solirubrobacteraceae bacterium]